jgi:hypothetical protein
MNSQTLHLGIMVAMGNAAALLAILIFVTAFRLVWSTAKGSDEPTDKGIEHSDPAGTSSGRRYPPTLRPYRDARGASS